MRARTVETSPRRFLWILTLAAVVALYAWNVRRSWFLGDDAFIAFRYSRHLCQGLGPVWNPGERVEGYTSFSWMVAMAAAIRAGLDPARVANLVGVACGAGLLACLTVFTARHSSWRDPYLWVAPLALAANGSFGAWSTGGLETMLFALVVFAAFAAFLRERTTGAARPLASSLFLAFAALTRPEGMLFAGMAAGLFALDAATGRRPWRALIAWCVPCVAIVGAHLLWRHAYYGQWLPNTFYAKVPGLWWDQGLRYLGLFVENYRILWLSPLIVACLVLRRDTPALLGAGVTVVWLVYLAAIGGDRFEFRFLVVIFPFLSWMLGDGVARIAGLLRRLGAPRVVVHGVAGACALALLVAVFAGARHDETAMRRAGVTPTAILGQYARSRAIQGRELRDWVERGVLPGDLVLCVGGAGALPYYSGLVTIDAIGLSDAEVAHAPLAKRGIIAHEREPTYEYLERRGVVIFDVLNRVVHRTEDKLHQVRSVAFDGRRLPLRAVPVEGSFLIFATTRSDAELERIFHPLPVLRPRGEGDPSP